MKASVYSLTLLAIFFLSGCDEDPVTGRSPKLAYYTESFEIPDLGFESQLKVTYKYDWYGKVQKYTVLSHNPDTDTMEEQRYFAFTYSNGKVDYIRGYLPGEKSPYVEYSYQYSADAVSKITENNHSTGINSEASFAYPDDGTVKVSYVFSNGGSFDYEFDYASGNVLTDVTRRGSQLCSSGEYTYDQYHNPFKDLGYVDYLLTNLSANNKLTENVDYVACAFPSFIPESYAYEYNDKGYPISATTFYKSDGGIKKSKKEFFYVP